MLNLSRVGLAKRIVELEEQCEWLKEDKLKLKEQVRMAKGEEERVMGKYMKAKGEYVEMKEKFVLGKRKWREEGEKIRGKCWQLKEENRKLCIDLKEGVSAMSGGDEASVKLRATEAEVERLKGMLGERDGGIANLLGKIEAMDRQNSRLEIDFKSKMDMEATKTKLEEQKNSELIQRFQVLEREKKQMVAEAYKLRKEKSDEAERTISVQKALEAEVERLKSSLGDRDGSIANLLGKIEAMDRQNNRLEIDFKSKMAMEATKTKLEDHKNSKLVKRFQVLEREKEQMVAEAYKLRKEKSDEAERTISVQKALKAEVEHLKSSLGERDGRIANLLGKIEAMDRQNNRLEIDFKSKMAMEATKTKLEEQKNLELIKRFEVLEREKKQMVAEVFNLRKEKSDEVERTMSVKKDLEAEKKRLEEADAQNLDLVGRIELLERVKNAMQDGVSKLKREMNEKVSKVMKEKMDVEAEKRAFEGDSKKAASMIKRNEALEKQKKELESKLYRTNMEKDAEIRSILKEQMASKEKGKKMILEREETINVLCQENKTLEAQNKQLEMEKASLVLQMEENSKNSELIQKFEVLEQERDQMVAEVSKLQKEKSDEVERSFRAKKHLDAEKKRSEEVEAKNYELAKRIESLEGVKKSMQDVTSELNRVRCENVRKMSKEKMAAEAEKRAIAEDGKKTVALLMKKNEADKKILEEVEAHNSELAKRIELLERVQKVMQDGVSKLKRDTSEEVDKILKEKMAAQAERRAFEVQNKRMAAQLMKKNEASDNEKMEMEARLSQANMEMDTVIGRISKELMEIKEQGNKSILERDEAINVLYQKNKTLEAQNKKFQGLETEMEKMVAEVSKLQKEKSDEAERSISAKKALEAEKKRSDEIEAKNVELAKRIGLRFEKSMQDRVSKLKRENSEEVRKIMKEKMAAEAEKRAFEEDTNKIIAQLIKENKEMEAKVSRANMEKDAEIKRILKEQGQEIILERDEVIKVLYEENKTLEAQNKQLKMEKALLVIKREKDVELVYQVHPMSNGAGILATPAAQNIPGIVKIEKQTILASSCKRIQPLSETSWR